MGIRHHVCDVLFIGLGFEELFGDTAFDASLAQLFNINTQQLIIGLRE